MNQTSRVISAVLSAAVLLLHTAAAQDTLDDAARRAVVETAADALLNR
jgi:hypothetical protein